MLFQFGKGCVPENNFSTVIAAYKASNNTWVNFVLNPKPFYADPFKNIFECSSVERNV